MDTKDHKPPGDVESLLNRLEEQLERIETDEFMRGLSSEELQDRGFTGSRPIVIERASVPNSETEEGLLFADMVDFVRLEKGRTVDTIQVSEINNMPAVKTGQLFASRPVAHRIELHPGKNVRKELQGDRETFVAQADGVIVLAGNTINVCSVDVDCTVDLQVSEDRMMVTMHCTPGSGGGTALTPAFVMAALEARHISHGIVEEVITRTLDAIVEKREPGATALIAQGTPAIPGKNGWVEYSFDDNAEGYDFKVLPDGNVDYRSTCRIAMTEKDALLATVFGPQPGTPGCDVFGDPIPASEGIAAVLAVGSGVRTSGDGMCFFAETAGSIALNGSVIEVLNTYVVNGDVDYSSGNITFNGNVVINGTVLDGFEVKAQGDIFVSNNVEAATLEAGRDVIIRGGILGRGKGLVTAGRHLRAGYAQNARLEAQGDVRMGNFVINSHIYTSGQLVIREGRGSIMGGEVFAQKGVDAKFIGSENGVKTCVTAGTDYLVQRKIADIDLAITFCANNIQKIEQSLKSAVSAIDAVTSISADRKALLQKVMQKRKDLAQSMQAMRGKRADLVIKARDTGECMIKVSKDCFADVQIRIKDLSMTIGAKRSAVRFYEDKKTGEIAVGPY